MGDDDELRAGEITQHSHEPIDVGLVEGRVDFVEYAEWAGTGTENRQQEGDACHGFLAT